MNELSVRMEDVWLLGYIIMLCELQKVFCVKQFERIVTFVKVEKFWEEVVDACSKTLSTYTWRDWVVPQRTSIWIVVSILAKTWTGHLLDTHQKCKISGFSLMVCHVGCWLVTIILGHHIGPVFKGQAVQEECQEQVDVWVYREQYERWLVVTESKGMN